VGGTGDVTDPVTDPVVTDPVTDPVVTDPVTDPVVTDPVTDPVVTDPVTDPVVTDPVTDPVVTDPVTDPVVTDPVDAGDQVDTGLTESEQVISDSQQGDQQQNQLMQDQNGQNFIVEPNGTTWNMQGQQVDPIQGGTVVGTWDPSRQMWAGLPAAGDGTDAISDLDLQNEIEVSTPLTWEQVTQNLYDPALGQRQVNLAYEQARQNIQQAQRDQGQGGRGMSADLGTQYAYGVDPYVQSITKARTQAAMIPYNLAMENARWRDQLSDEQLRQMLSLGQITAQDWYSRAFREQEFKRISDAMMLQLASPFLESLLGSVLGGSTATPGSPQAFDNMMRSWSQLSQAQQYQQNQGANTGTQYVNS
jgi:hypothetical protein